MRSLTLFWALLWLSLESAAAAEVTTRSGVVAGVEQSSVLVFKGIPYARAPIGALRWHSPEPAPVWAESRPAQDFAPSCPQPQRRDRRVEVGTTSEDCLYINVWSPGLAGRHPVMVWIHGGAFRVGSGSVPVYDGSRFAASGIVLVTFNYRLGRFGFFAHPALGDDLGNFALADQIAALEWVRDNIAGFGGDPARVTLFGESAGGASVLHLLVSPAAAGLFQGAIIESGGGHQLDPHVSEPRGSRKSLLDEGIVWAHALGIPESGRADDLRALATDVVLGSRSIDSGIASVGPVIDGRIVPADPGVLLLRGTAPRIPVIVGSNSFEASVLAAFGTDGETVVANADVDRNQVAVAYGALSGEALADRLFGDASFVAPARHVARSVAANGGTAFLYHFDYVATRRRGRVPGAAHGSEIPFVFGNLDRLPFASALVTDEDRAMSELMHRYWVNFAKTGTPNGVGLPHWPAVQARGEETLVFASRVRVEPAFRSEALDLHQRRWLSAEDL